jgi:N-formylglutamate amidohydrolase
MRRLILHIPHSSVLIPFKSGYLLNDGLINAEILKLTDWYTDDIFESNDDIRVIAEFSRIFCDVERFSDDSHEEMAKFGMGVLYEKTDDGKSLRNVTLALRDKLLNEYYWPHHDRLTQEVDYQLKNFNRATIIDCHSFPEIPFKCSQNKEPERPDINIGTDSFHTPKGLLDLTENYFSGCGLKVLIDKPYSGSIVPLKHYRKNSNVNSIMVEINRKLYLEGPSNKKSINYIEIKHIISKYLEKVRG